MHCLDTQLTARLAERKRRSLYRRRCLKDSPEGAEIDVEGRRYINFSSNDYLGLANHPKVREAFRRGLATYGVGSGAAHLVTGYSRPHQELEEALAEFTGRPRALVFSTGYMANIGALTALAGRFDTVIQDRLNHTSMLDAARMTRARLRRYPHADVEALEKMLGSTHRGQSFVLTDAVFSMDGDIAPLPAIAALCRHHNAVLMVDDAHGFGVLGTQGQGSLSHFTLDVHDVPVLMATLGKAVGVFGAFIAGSDHVVEILIQQARSYIFTTALPPAMAAAIRASLALVRSEGWRREKLSDLIQYLRTGAGDRGISLEPSMTPIQPLMLGEAHAALEASERLRTRGLFLTPIRPPTVPTGTARLRISLTANHTRDHLDQLLDALEHLS